MADLSSLPPDQLAIALLQPALSPPANVTPNFENPPNQNGLAHFIIAFCLSISTIFFLIRVYVRFIYLQKSHLEDYLLISAYGVFIGFISRGYWQLGFIGFFVHQWNK
ncbi:hypothetical protein F4678DRAFT_209515 [Xylaria arbuscula]|nr:hypothetical protein F4678DRAFT_209515 [Xylaria arbuscula]